MLKKKSFLSVLSFMLAMLMFLLSFPTSATTISETAPEGVNKVSKIDKALLEVMAEASPDEKIPVSIWYNDIDQAEVDTLTTEKVGFDRDNVSIDYEMPSAELLTSLKAGETGAESEMQAYLERTESKRLEERRRTDDYIMSRREISREKYNEKSASVLTEIAIPEEDILFKSQYAPMIIAELTAEEIYRLNGSSEIDSIYFDGVALLDNDSYSMESLSDRNYENIALDSSTSRTGTSTSTETYQNNIEIIKRVIGHKDVTDRFGLTGEGVDIGVVEQGGQWIFDPEIPEEQLEGVSGIYLNITDGGSHITRTIKTIISPISGFAKGAFIYTANSTYSQVEALLAPNRNVKIILMNYGGTPNTQYGNWAKWLDHIIAQHGVVVCAAAGNSSQNGEVCESASAYNVISVGSYFMGPSASENDVTLVKTDDTLAYTSNYNNTAGIEKPDIIMPYIPPGGATSYANPVIVSAIAMMYELKPSLSVYPQAVKAIVLASCHRKVNPSANGETAEIMTQGITDRQGAGAPDVWVMASIVYQGTYGVGRIKGNSTVGTRRFVMPKYASNCMNVSITWLRENSINEGYHNQTPGDGFNLCDEVDLDLLLYRNNERIPSQNLQKSSTEMIYVYLDNEQVDYQIQITKASSYSSTVRYGYAYSVDDPIYLEDYDDSYLEEEYGNGVYYLRNYFYDKYLTLNTPNGETTLSSYNGEESQMWIVKTNNSKTEVYPGYGSVEGKLSKGNNFTSGTQTLANAILGDEGMNFDIITQRDQPISDGGVAFFKANNTENYILSVLNGTQGVFVKCSSNDAISDYRLWVLEKVNYQRGDVNLDFSVNVKDVTKLQKHLAGLETVTQNIELFCADANGDDIVSIHDVTRIQTYIASLES